MSVVRQSLRRFNISCHPKLLRLIAPTGFARSSLFFAGLMMSALVLSAEEPREYSFYLMLTVARDSRDSPGWRVEAIQAQSVTGDSPVAAVEDVLTRRKIAAIVGNVPVPFAFEELARKISAVDTKRRWFEPSPVPSAAGIVHVYIKYRYVPSVYTIIMQAAGDDATTSAPLIPVALDQGVILELHGPRAANPDFQVAAKAAAESALKIAQDYHAGPGLPPPVTADLNALSRALQSAFFISRYGGSQLYQPRLEGSTRLVGLDVKPVFIPGAVDFELAAWKTYEKTPGLSNSRIKRLETKRTNREREIKGEFAQAGVLNAPFVNEAVLKVWSDSVPGRRYEPVFDRTEGDQMIFTVSDAPKIMTLEATFGASYNAEDRAQATSSYAFALQHYFNTAIHLDGAYGTKADSFSGAISLAPSKPMRGWRLNINAKAARERRDEAYFDGLNNGGPVHWRKSHLEATLAASRPAPIFTTIPATAWHTDLMANLAFRQEDAAIREPLPLPADAVSPASSVALGLEVRSTRTFPNTHNSIMIAARTQVARSLGSDNSGRFTRQETALTFNYISHPDKGRGWKSQAELRYGTVAGRAPLAEQFQAGGDTWLRGLQEGEIAGSGYFAGSIATGPNVSALFGGKDDGKTQPAYILVFIDAGRVRDRIGAGTGGLARTAHGYGVEVNLEQMPLGDFSADLVLGYAYSPESRINRHGTFFIRIDLPLGK